MPRTKPAQASPRTLPTVRPTVTRKGQPQKRSKKVVDISSRLEVSSTRTESPGLDPATLQRKKTMTLTLKGTSKNGKAAFYTGAASILRIQTKAFPNEQAPQTIEVADGVFAPAKVRLTPEERKAQRAAQPKPTLAERIAKREAQLQKDKARLAAQQASM